ncbi:hypothetical protein CIB48_g5036, partial [Xylaria polymorpha]
MPPKTVQQLRTDQQLLNPNNSRYGLYSQNNHERDSAGRPTLLLMLREAGNIPGGNRDRVLNQVRGLIGQDCSSLHLAGKDFFQGEIRDLYANNRAEEFVNQADAATLKAISLQQQIDGINTQGQTIDSILRDHFGDDYVRHYGDANAALNEVASMATRYIATRYRHYQQLFHWNPQGVRDLNLGNRRNDWGTQVNRSLHTGKIIDDGLIAVSGKFRLRGDPRDPNDLPNAEASARRQDHRVLFQEIWGYSVENAVKLIDRSLVNFQDAVEESDGITNSANLRDVFLWMTEYIDMF